MILYRIATTGRNFDACDKTGAGAAVNPGRWNDSGEYVLYCAPTIALAVLETSAHITSKALPLNKYLVQIDVPDALWQMRERWMASELPADWDAIPAGHTSIRLGSSWYHAQRSALLEVPSAIVPEESAVLIHCRHPDTAQIALRALRKYSYESLLGR